MDLVELRHMQASLSLPGTSRTFLLVAIAACRCSCLSAEEKRLALRAVFADSDCRRSEHVESAMLQQGYSLPDPLRDTAELRSDAQQAFQAALWSCKATFRENDYQQILELECPWTSGIDSNQ